MSETYTNQDKSIEDLGHTLPSNRKLSALEFSLLFKRAVISPDGAEARFLESARQNGWTVIEPTPRDTSISDIRPEFIEGYGRTDNES